MPRKHLLFPTFEEINANPNIARSDHLTLLTKVPLDQEHSLHIVSLNILGGEECSGIHPFKMEIPEGHTLHRYQCIAKGLGKSISKHNVDVILLQEAAPSIVPYLEKSLGSDWKILVDRFGIISCYTKNRLKLQNRSENERARISSMQLSDDSTGLSIDVHNIWGIYNPFPQYMENQYRTLLTNTTSNVSVIMGDTNSRIAPIDNLKRNLSTGIIPALIAVANEWSPDIQITDHPDGGFYRNQSGTIAQLETNILDFDTAEIVIDKRGEREVNVCPEYRMVMCLDDYYTKTPLIDEKTIFQYEDLIRHDLNNEKLIVRMASDSYNNKALAIRFPKNSEAFLHIQNELKNTAGCQLRSLDSTATEDRGERFSCVFVPIDKLDLLHKAVQNAITGTVLKHQIANRIRAEILKLSKYHWYFRNVPEKISSLMELNKRITDAPSKSTAEDLLSIIKVWENEIPQPSPVVNENKINNNHELMGLHQNIFFSLRRPSISTSTQDTLKWLKEALGDKPIIEAQC